MARILYAPVDAIPRITAGRTISYMSGHQAKQTLDNDIDSWWMPHTYDTSSLYIDLGTDVSVDAIPIWLHNYNEEYENPKAWRIYYSTDNTTYTPLGVPILFATARSGYVPVVTWTTGLPKTARYWRIDFINFELPPVTILPEISAVWFMIDYSLPWCHQIPETNKLLYHNRISTMRSGSTYVSDVGAVGKQRNIQRSFLFTTATDQWNNLRDAYKAAHGSHLPIIFQSDLESAVLSVFMFEDTLCEHRIAYDTYEPTITLREIGFKRIPVWIGGRAEYRTWGM